MSAAQVRSHGALHASALGNGMGTPNAMATTPSGDANDAFAQELGLLLRGKSRLESILGARDLPQRSGSAPPSVEGSLSSMGGLLGNPSFGPLSNRPSNLSRTGIGVSDDSELPVNVSANERELRSDPAYVAYYHSHVNLNPRLPPPLISWDKYRYSQQLQLQPNSDDSLLLADSRLRNSDPADLSKIFSPRVSFQSRKELTNEGDKLGLAFGVLSDPRNEIPDWAAEPKGAAHDPSLGLAVRPKSLVDLIQEDFPRTPSPVYTHSRTPSRAGHLEDVADSLDFQLSHIRESINSSEALHSPSLLSSPQGLSLHSRSSTPKPINGLSNLSTASLGGTSTLSLTTPISRASSPLPQILTNRTASPRVSDQNGAAQAFLASSRHVNDTNASVVAELAAALQTFSLQASQNSIPSVEELQDQITQHQQIQHQQHLQEQSSDKGDFEYEIQSSQPQVQSSLRQRLLDQELQSPTIADQDLQRQGPFPVKSSLQQQLNRSQLPRQHQNQSQANQSLTDPTFQHLSALDTTLRNNATLASRFSLNDTPNLAQNLPAPSLQVQQQAAAAAAAMYSMAANPYFQNAQANAAAAAAASMYAPQFAAMGMGNFPVNPTLVSPMMAAYPPTIPMGFDAGSPPTALTPQSPLSGIRPTIPGVNSLNPLFKYGGDGGGLANVSPQFLPHTTSDPIYLSYMQQRAMEEARGGNAMSLSPVYFGSPPAALLSLSNPSIPGSPVSANVLNPPLTQITSSPSRRGDERGKGRGGVHSPGSTYAGWHARAEGGSGGDSMDFRCSSLLEEFKNNKTRRFELQDIVNHVVEFSVDQHGSRFIQQKLEVSPLEDKDLVFQEVKPHALTLMTDVFGNYVIQKFFEHGSDQHRAELSSQLTGHVLALSLQMYGCRVIQKALEVVELEQQIKIVSELDGHVMRCVRDQNGNHVIQKCIECVPSEHIAFIIQSFYGQVVALSTHPYGCRVIQRVLEHCNDEPKQKAIMAEILRSTCILAQDQYGNYVVQHVLEHGNNQERSEIITKLAGQIVQMSQHKFASNVIEKCLEFGGPAERQILINEMLGHTDENEPLQAMMKDQFANYVVQKVLETCNDYQREMLLGRIKVHLHALKKYTYGKHIVARVEKLVTAGGRIQSRNDHSREKDLSSRNELLMT